MSALLSVILPIFVLIGVGFTAVRTRYVPSSVVEALGAFVLNFALPAVILHALLQQDLQRTLDWGYIFAYAAGSLIAFVAILALFRLAMGKSLSHAAAAALGASASNSGFVGFPVASLALGAPALAALPLSMLVENIIIIPLALALGEASTQKGEGLRDILSGTLRRLSRTPLIVAIFMGVVLSAAGVSLPQPLSTALKMMADASVPCALFVVGGTLAGLKAGSIAGDIMAIVAGKLLLHPLAVGAGFLLAGDVPAELMAAGLILASSPMLTVYPILGARLGHGGMCAAALLIATTASFLTLIAVLGLVLP
jgi:Predicted permeases